MEGSLGDHYGWHSSVSRYDPCRSVTLSQRTQTICPSWHYGPDTDTGYLISDRVWYRTGRSRINGSPALPKMKWSSPVTMKITPALMDLWCHCPGLSLVTMTTRRPLIGPRTELNPHLWQRRNIVFSLFLWDLIMITFGLILSSAMAVNQSPLQLAKRWTHCGGSWARIAS